MILGDAPLQRHLWTRALLVAAGLHAAALGAMFVRLPTAMDASVEMPAIAVEMAMPSTIPAPVHDVPTPRQVEAPQQTPRPQPNEKKSPFDPPPLSVPDVKPEVVVPPRKDTPRPDKVNPLPPAPTTTEQAAPDLKPDTIVAAPVTGGASAGKSTRADLWSARVRSRVELMKRYPGAAAQQREEDDINLLLTIDRSGHLLDTRIRASRGFDLLDAAAIEAVQRAAPFDKPPVEIEGDPIRYALIIRFHTSRR